MKFPAVLVLALLTAIGGSGCEAARKARMEREQRALWGDGYEKARAEYDAARLAAWMLSWEDGPPVHLSDRP